MQTAKRHALASKLKTAKKVRVAKTTGDVIDA
jgi:hypothetical protein